MIRFIISIAILSKYEKDAFDNNAKSRKSTLRDDYNCVMNKNDTTG